MSRCATCKYLKGIYSYDENGLCTEAICTANKDCYVKIDRLSKCDDFAECEDYEHYDPKLVEDHSDVEIRKYDWNEGQYDTDCCECGYFYATTMSYPSGECVLLNERCGLGCYCELFCKRDDKPTMDTRVVGNMKDVKKLAIQFEMLLKEKDGKEDEK